MTNFVSANEYNRESLTLSIDNDGLLGTDKDYTNGLFLKYNSKSYRDLKNNVPSLFTPVIAILPLAEHSNKNWGITFGQQIWTPSDITVVEEQADERPYTGFIFLEAHFVEFSSDMANKYSLMLGNVGPDSFGETSQKTVHNLIGSDTPAGWDRQIENQTVFNLSYAAHRLLSRSTTKPNDGVEASLTGRVNVGNFQSEVALGGIIRWGSDLAKSFASVGSKPGHYIDPSVLAKSRSGQFYYVALEGRYRFQDITIDGARPKHLFDVKTDHWQSTFSTGAVYYQESWGVALSVATSTPDYKEDRQNFNSTASIELFWRT
ncbi:lipid A deacylase LpxR family protein [Colwellia sp. E2M01]|nr:lipid A deacylase LpxR family protein [Colwellia sp. E2M01]